MKELVPASENPPEFPYFTQKLELEVEGKRFDTKVIVFLPQPQDNDKSAAGDIIRLYDYDQTTGNFVITGTADDIRELDTEATGTANILGGYPVTEILTFYPRSQDEVMFFNRFMEKTQLFGPLLDSLGGYYFSGQTKPDGFFYEYEECRWKRRPRLFFKGIPFVENMQFSLQRRPDYRVPPDLLKKYKSQSPEKRAFYFLRSLEIFSQGRIKILKPPLLASNQAKSLPSPAF